MLQSLLQFEEMPKFLDATDGLGAAVCHYFQNGKVSVKSGKKSGSFTGWKAFLQENPDRKG